MSDISRQSRLVAGTVLVILPTVVSGGLALLMHLTKRSPGYVDNALRQDLWRAGHAHAGVLLILSLVVLRYVDEAALPPALKWVVRLAAPTAAILISAAFFLSVLSPQSTAPGPLLKLAYPGALILVIGVLTLGVGLIRAGRKGA